MFAATSPTVRAAYVDGAVLLCYASINSPTLFLLKNLVLKLTNPTIHFIYLICVYMCMLDECATDIASGTSGGTGSLRIKWGICDRQCNNINLIGFGRCGPQVVKLGWMAEEGKGGHSSGGGDAVSPVRRHPATSLQCPTATTTNTHARARAHTHTHTHT